MPAPIPAYQQPARQPAHAPVIQQMPIFPQLPTLAVAQQANAPVAEMFGASQSLQKDISYSISRKDTDGLAA